MLNTNEKRMNYTNTFKSANDFATEETVADANIEKMLTRWL